MDPRIKNALGAVGVLGLIAVSVAVLNWTNTFARSAPAYATISISGQGKSVGTPDVAEFTFSVVSEGGKDVSALQKDNTTKMNGAIDFVKSQGVDAKDIETLGYDIEPRYQSYSC